VREGRGGGEEEERKRMGWRRWRINKEKGEREQVQNQPWGGDARPKSEEGQEGLVGGPRGQSGRLVLRRGAGWQEGGILREDDDED
jgi:hypothetical protein